MRLPPARYGRSMTAPTAERARGRRYAPAPQHEEGGTNGRSRSRERTRSAPLPLQKFLEQGLALGVRCAARAARARGGARARREEGIELGLELCPVLGFLRRGDLGQDVFGGLVACPARDG